MPDVREAIVIQIAKLGSHPGDRFTIVGISHPDIHRYFFKGFALEIMKEGVRKIVVGDKNIGESIAVIIVKSYSHALTEPFRDAGLIGNVSEGTITIIAV